jgi:hypothetical protein
MPELLQQEPRREKPFDLVRLESFSVFFTQLFDEFEHTVCGIHLPFRRRMISVLSKHSEKTAEDTEHFLQTEIEQGCLKALMEKFDSIVKPIPARKFRAIEPTQGTTLTKVVELAILYAVCMNEALCSLEKIKEYCESVIHKSRKNILGVKAKEVEFISKLDRYSRYLRKKIPRIKKSFRGILTDIQKYDFKSDFPNLSQKARLLPDGMNFSFSVEADLLQKGCSINLPIQVDAGTHSFKNIDFKSTTLSLTPFIGLRNLRFHGCSGSLDLTGIKHGGQLQITDSPNLVLRITQSRFKSIHVSGSLDRLTIRSSGVNQLNISGKMNTLNLLGRATIKSTRLSESDIHTLFIKNSGACLSIQKKSRVGTLQISNNSESSVFLEGSHIDSIHFDGDLHLIADQSHVKNLDLTKGGLAFAYLLNSQIETTRRRKKGGIYQEIIKQPSSQFVFFSKTGDQADTKEQLTIDTNPLLQKEGARSHLTKFINQHKKPLTFFRVDPTAGLSTAGIVLRQAAPLLLLRENIDAEKTAWLPVLLERYPLYRGHQAEKIAMAFSDEVARQFLLWRAQHDTDHHRTSLASMSPHSRHFSLQYFQKILWEREEEKKEVINKASTDFNLEMAGVILIAKMIHFLDSYMPGRWKRKEKNTVKNSLLLNLKQSLVDKESNNATTANKILYLISEAESKYATLCNESRVFRTYLSLTKDIIKKHAFIVCLSKNSSEIITHELKKPGTADNLKAILKKHRRNSAALLLPDAVLETLQSLEKEKRKTDNPKTIEKIDSILSRSSVTSLKKEVSNATRLKSALERVRKLAGAYRPVIALFGNGKKKLGAMEQLAIMATVTSNTAGILAAQQLNVMRCLEYLRHKRDEAPQRGQNQAIFIGRDMWKTRSRRGRGYDDTLDTMHYFFKKELGIGHSHPVKEQPSDWSYSVIPGLEEAIQHRHESFFKFKQAAGA